MKFPPRTNKRATLAIKRCASPLTVHEHPIRRATAVAIGLILYFGGGALRLSQLFADSVPHQLTHRMETERAHDIVAVRLGGLDADAKVAGDFLVALALCQQLYDLALARRQAPAYRARSVSGDRIALAVPLHDEIGHSGRKKWLVPRHGVDRANQITPGVGLEHVATGARVQHFTDHLL